MSNRADLIELKCSIDKGLNFLEKSCRPITGFQNDCIRSTRDNLEKNYFPENVFTCLNGLDLLGDRLSSRCKDILIKFVSLDHTTGTVNFNKYADILPDDVDCTALYHYVFLKQGINQNDKRIVDVARLIYLNCDENGIIQVYYPPCEEKRKGRLDATCLANAMRFLYYIDAACEAEKTENYLYDWLVSEEYLNGTRYYSSPDAFFYYCSKAVALNERARKKFEEPLLKALKKRSVELKEERVYPLDLAMRILTLNTLGKLNSPNFSDWAKSMVGVLRNMQDQKSGAWPKDALFKMGSSDAYLGGEVVSTIFATSALIEFHKTVSTIPLAVGS